MRNLGQFTRVSICLGLIVMMTGCRAMNGGMMNRVGMRQYQRGNYAAARQNFARAVADDPYHPDFRHNLAMAMQKQGDQPGAERILRHNLSLDPMHQPTYHALAQNLVQQQRQGEAQELLAEWSETQPYLTESHVEMAWLQREMGNHAAAEQSLRRALQVEPNNPVALSHLGQIHHETGRSDEAAAYYQRSLTSRWDQPEVQSRLATVSSRRDRRRSAMAMNGPEGSIAFAQGPMLNDQSIVAPNGMMMMSQNIAAMPLEDPVNTARRPSRRARRHSPENLVGYPLPDYGTQTAQWAPAGTVMTDPAMAYQQQVITEQPFGTPTPGATDQIIPSATITSQPTFDTPIIASGPALTPQADPAHSTGTIAGLPVVDPY